MFWVVSRLLLNVVVYLGVYRRKKFGKDKHTYIYVYIYIYKDAMVCLVMCVVGFQMKGFHPQFSRMHS